MIKINKNDSIVDIILKIKNCQDKEISLEFPFWHPILHNYTSLKILKTKADKKELIIFTNDKTAKRIWKKLGIKYNLIVKPDIPESDYTFREYFLYTIKNYIQEIKTFFNTKARENTFAKYQKIYKSWKIWFFTFFLVLSILLLVFIFYFAVNKTYIIVSPEVEIRQKWRNFTFEQMWNDSITLNSSVIKLKEVQKNTSLSTKILASWIDENESKRATWRVKIQNFTSEDVYLVKNTRMTTKSGIVFLLDSDVKIPASTKVENSEDATPGEIDVSVTARIDDLSWKITWVRWNIKSGEIMTFPWLKENKDKIYATSIIDFSGWTNSSKRILTKKDLENAKTILKWKLEEAWINEIKAELEAENKVNNTKYEIFWIEWWITYTDFKYYGIENLKEWMELEEFEISGSLTTKVYAYNKEVVMNKLRNVIKEWVLENVESIFNIDENSLSIVNVIWKEENPFRVKATAQVDVSYIQNFLSDTNNYVEKLKSQIAWLSKEEAEKILLNTWKISNVNIEVRPFFINNISKIVDNIKFEIK